MGWLEKKRLEVALSQAELARLVTEVTGKYISEQLLARMEAIDYQPRPRSKEAVLWQGIFGLAREKKRLQDLIDQAQSHHDPQALHAAKQAISHLLVGKARG